MASPQRGRTTGSLSPARADSAHRGRVDVRQEGQGLTSTSSSSSAAAARLLGKACASKSVAESPDCAPVARLRPRVQNEQLGVRRGGVQNDGMGAKIQGLATVQSLGPSDSRATAGGTGQTKFDELFAGSR